MNRYGLTERQLAELKAIFRPFIPPILRVALFGSRAQGTHKPASDIDIIVYGDVPETILNTLRLAFQESFLPVTVDIVADNQPLPDSLRQHIAAVACTLFVPEDFH